MTLETRQIGIEPPESSQVAISHGEDAGAIEAVAGWRKLDAAAQKNAPQLGIWRRGVSCELRAITAELCQPKNESVLMALHTLHNNRLLYLKNGAVWFDPGEGKSHRPYRQMLAQKLGELGTPGLRQAFIENQDDIVKRLFATTGAKALRGDTFDHYDYPRAHNSGALAANWHHDDNAMILIHYTDPGTPYPKENLLDRPPDSIRRDPRAFFRTTAGDVVLHQPTVYHGFPLVAPPPDGEWNNRLLFVLRPLYVDPPR